MFVFGCVPARIHRELVGLASFIVVKCIDSNFAGGKFVKKNFLSKISENYVDSMEVNCCYFCMMCFSNYSCYV